MNSIWLTLVVLLAACGSTASTDHRQGDMEQLPGDSVEGEAGAAIGLQVVRLHLTIPQLADESIDATFPPACPEGEDCFLSASFHRDGAFEFDDLRGRVGGELARPDYKLLAELFFADGVDLGPNGDGRFDCPGVPADYSVSAVFGARFADGLEVIDTESGGCVAGELTNLPNHPLAQLRRLVYESRRRYVECVDSGTAEEPPRALCRADFAAVRKW